MRVPQTSAWLWAVPPRKYVGAPWAPRSAHMPQQIGLGNLHAPPMQHELCRLNGPSRRTGVQHSAGTSPS
eukprot:2111995-Lingulodinium_polyedra.AAC.1